MSLPMILHCCSQMCSQHAAKCMWEVFPIDTRLWREQGAPGSLNTRDVGCRMSGDTSVPRVPGIRDAFELAVRRLVRAAVERHEVSMAAPSWFAGGARERHEALARLDEEYESALAELRRLVGC